MVQLSLRDEKVWRDGSAEADRSKPTVAHGCRSATKDKNQRVVCGVAAAFRLILFVFGIPASSMRFTSNGK